MSAPAPRQTITENEPSDNLWALDLEEDPYVPGRRHPCLAHLIVAIRQEPHRGEVRTSACSREFTAGDHPCGWWGTNGRDLPLPEAAVHCGADAAGTFRLDRGMQTARVIPGTATSPERGNPRSS